jgi:hypothetical protein
MKRSASDASLPERRSLKVIESTLVEARSILAQLHEACTQSCRELIDSLTEEMMLHPDYRARMRLYALQEPIGAMSCLAEFLPPYLYEQWVADASVPPLLGISVLFRPGAVDTWDTWRCELTFGKKMTLILSHSRGNDIPLEQFKSTTVEFERESTTNRVTALVSSTLSECEVHDLYGRDLFTVAAIEEDLVKRPHLTLQEAWTKARDVCKNHRASAIASFLFHAWLRCGAKEGRMDFGMAFGDERKSYSE